MRRSLRALGCTIAVLAAWGCPEEEGPACTELGCAGGFDLWMTSTNDSDVFEEGRYDIWVDVAGGELFVQCFIDASGGGECNPPSWREQPTEDIVATVVFGMPTTQQVINTPAIQLHFAGQSEAPAGTNVFGPTPIAVEVDRDTRKVGQETYTPQYDRNTEFNGPEECGYCDSLERELLRLTP